MYTASNYSYVCCWGHSVIGREACTVGMVAPKVSGMVVATAEAATAEVRESLKVKAKGASRAVAIRVAVGLARDGGGDGGGDEGGGDGGGEGGGNERGGTAAATMAVAMKEATVAAMVEVTMEAVQNGGVLQREPAIAMLKIQNNHIHARCVRHHDRRGSRRQSEL